MTEAELKEKLESFRGRLPEGYIMSMVARYPTALTDRKTGRSYTWSVSLLSTELMDMPRGIGNNIDEAFEHALTNVMGDDGLSKAFRDLLQGPKH